MTLLDQLILLATGLVAVIVSALIPAGLAELAAYIVLQIRSPKRPPRRRVMTRA